MPAGHARHDFQVDRLPGCRLHKPARCRRRALRRDCRHRWPASRRGYQRGIGPTAAPGGGLRSCRHNRRGPNNLGHVPTEAQPFRRQLCAAAANVATGSAGRAAGRVVRRRERTAPTPSRRRIPPRLATTQALLRKTQQSRQPLAVIHTAGSRPAPQAPGQFWWRCREPIWRGRPRPGCRQPGCTDGPASHARRQVLDTRTSGTQPVGSASSSAGPTRWVRRPSALAWGLAGCRPVGGGQQSATAGVRRGTMGADAFYNGRKEPDEDSSNGLASLYLLSLPCFPRHPRLASCLARLTRRVRSAGTGDVQRRSDSALSQP